LFFDGLLGRLLFGIARDGLLMRMQLTAETVLTGDEDDETGG